MSLDSIEYQNTIQYYDIPSCSMNNLVYDFCFFTCSSYSMMTDERIHAYDILFLKTDFEESQNNLDVEYICCISKISYLYL
jgi:hypothetical protein